MILLKCYYLCTIFVVIFSINLTHLVIIKINECNIYIINNSVYALLPFWVSILYIIDIEKYNTYIFCTV